MFGWLTWTLIVAISGAVPGLAQDYPVNFDLTSGDCSENSTVVMECNGLYSQAYDRAVRDNALTEEVNCMLLTETLACVETALCHCNFSATHPQLESGYRSAMVLYHYYNNLTQCSNVSRDTIQGEVTGPLDVEEGVNCSQYNRTAGDLSLSLAVSQLDIVKQVDDVCPGVESCYYDYDRALEVALYQKDWPQFCQTSLELLECLVNASCECGRTTHLSVLGLINTERRIYRNTCNTIRPEATASEVYIRCPGSDICEWTDPQSTCRDEFNEAATASQDEKEYCIALYDRANCTEGLACRCGFYQQPQYYRSLALAKYEYDGVCSEEEHQKFPNHTGLNCTDDDRFTDAEKILVISLAEPAFVQQEEARCPGIQACYDVANRKSAEAHRMKDLAAICEVDAERISCVEEVYCQCGLLNELDVYTHLFNIRLNQARLCYSVTGFPPLTRCRGASTCRQGDPLQVCEAEYSYDSSLAQTVETSCQAIKSYITCAEEVGCACGLLHDYSSRATEVIYNVTTLSLKLYNEAGCVELIGGINPEEDGIDCPDFPDDDTRKRLILSYADSSEVAALAAGCEKVRACFQTNDEQRAGALIRRSYQQLCHVQAVLMDCVDKQYCLCGLNGTRTAEDYMATQLHSHQQFCSSIVNYERKQCVRPTSSAAIFGLSVGLILMTQLTSLTMTS